MRRESAALNCAELSDRTEPEELLRSQQQNSGRLCYPSAGAGGTYQAAFSDKKAETVKIIDVTGVGEGAGISSAEGPIFSLRRGWPTLPTP